MLTRAAALKTMEKLNGKGHRIPFQIAFVTADRDAWRRYNRINAELKALNPEDPKRKDLQSQMESIDLGGKVIRHTPCVLTGTRGKHAKTMTEMVKNPRHWVNKTRNIQLQPSEQIRKIHNALIVEFNGQPVLF
jgi:hypothetical protein